MTFAIDTNILIYAVGAGDIRNSAANDLVSEAFKCDAVVPIQVLAEFNNVCRRKKLISPDSAARRSVEWQAVFIMPQTSMTDVLAASTLAYRYDLAYFDALILTVAKAAGATTLISEDMHDGATYAGVRIINPFDTANAGSVADLLAA